MSADRNFTSQFSYSFERQVVSLMAAITVSSSGTVYTSNAPKAGIVMTRVSAGLYDLTIPNSYTALISASFMIQATSAADLQPQIVSSDVTSAKKVRIRTIAGATPTDLADTDKLFVRLDLRNSSL